METAQGSNTSDRYHRKLSLSSEEQGSPYWASFMYLDLSISANSLSLAKSRLTPTHLWTSVGTAVSEGWALLLFLPGVE